MLQKTTRFGLKGHYHIVYLRKDGTGLCSVSKGHQHGVTVQPPAIDPMTGQETGQPTWVLEEMDGHTHELAGNVDFIDAQDGLEDDKARVELVRSCFRKDEEYERESRKKGEESDKFYRGDQWDEVDKTALEDSDRPALVVNLVQPAIDVLAGYQRQNRTDIRFFPVEEGDARVADILTSVVKHVCDRNDFHYTESAVFEDQAIVGRGFYHAFADYDRDIRGEVVVEKFNWDDVYLAPHERIDLGDCERLTKAKWYKLDRVKQQYPEKADDLSSDFETTLSGGKEEREYSGRQGDQYESESKATTSNNPALVNLRKNEVRVLEMERRLYQRNPVFVFQEDDYVLSGSGWKPADVGQVKTIPGFTVVERPANRMQRLKVAGGVLLENEILDGEDFSIIPAYAKRRGHGFWGKVEGAKDPQREVNKRHSQGVDIVNKMTNHMWFYDQTTFADAREEKKFEEGASRPGLKVKLQKTERPPLRQDGAPVPAGVVEMEQNAVEKLQAILAVNPALMGSPGAGQQSGLAIVEGKKAALTGNEFLFDNLSYAKRRLALRLVKLIQQVYTPERMLRLLVNMNARQTVEVAGQPLQQYKPEELVALLENVDLTKYDVSVGESAASPTVRLANYTMLTEMAGKGLPIPPDMVIEASPMPDEMKQKAMKSLQASQQAAREAEDKKYQMEIGKTAIAKGNTGPGGGQPGQPQQPDGMTPEVYMKMQLDMAKLQLERDKFELEKATAMGEMELEREKIALEREKMQVEREKPAQGINVAT